MKFGHQLFATSFVFIIISAWGQTAICRPGLTASLGAGYTDNLYADSFGLGNSYLINTIKLSSSHFRKIKLRLFYELTYYEYDTYNLINNLLHSPGVSIYSNDRSSRFRWSLTGRGYFKKYTDEISSFDNNRLRFDLDASYFIRPGLQLKAGYQGEMSSYSEYDVLENDRHGFELEAAKTFPSRTTLNLGLAFTLRDFKDGNSTYSWTDLGFQIAQSLNIRTGLSISYLERIPSDGSRPLSTFYIISGVSAYWDSWRGRQARLSLKRILPSAILSRLELLWWDRKFDYDPEISAELPWLAGKSSRKDDGFSVSMYLRRQFNLRPGFGKYLAVSFSGAYGNNSSDDEYYSFSEYYIESSIEYSAF